MEYLEAFIAAPSYATIAKIKKSVINPRKLPGVDALDSFLTLLLVPEIDRRVARELAWEEFYRRIGAKYEDQCVIRNGDLDEYIRAEQVIQEKFAETEEN